MNIDSCSEQRTPTVWGDYTVWSQIQNVKPNYAAFNPMAPIPLSPFTLVILDELAGYNNDRDKHFNIQLQTKWQVPFIEGLSLGALGNIRYGDWNRKFFKQKAPQYQPDGAKVPYDSNKLQMDYSTSTQKSFDLNAIYNRSFRGMR